MRNPTTTSKPTSGTAARTTGASGLLGAVSVAVATVLMASCAGTATAAPAATPVTITLTGTGATASSNTGVSINGSTVTITAAGSYQFSGRLTDGRILVKATEADAVELILNGVDITTSTGPAVNVSVANTVTVTLAAGTTNLLTDGLAYPAEEKANAALFSSEDMTITGTGALTVKGNSRDGIASKDTLTIESGTINVTAVDDGIRGKDFLKINGGTITATTGGDGLKANNDKDAALGYLTVGGGTIAITANGDCLDAFTNVTIAGGAQTLSCVDNGVMAGTAVTMSAGTVTVTRAAEGMEALRVLVSGGALTLTCTEDGVNAVERGLAEESVSIRARAEVTGGTVIVNSGGDGFDSNGSLTFSGGTTVVNGPAAGDADEAAFDTNGAVAFSGGTVLAAGVNGSTKAPAATSAQGSISVRFGAAQAAGTIVHVVSSTGTEIAAFRSSKQFQGLVFSSNQIISGQNYRIYTGGSVSGTPVGGLYPAGSTTGATLVTTVSAVGA